MVRRILQLLQDNAGKRKRELSDASKKEQLEDEARKRRQQPTGTKQLRG